MNVVWIFCFVDFVKDCVCMGVVVVFCYIKNVVCFGIVFG